MVSTTSTPVQQGGTFYVPGAQLKSYVNGTYTATFDANAQVIIPRVPQSGTDAVNKDYVDTIAGQLSTTVSLLTNLQSSDISNLQSLLSNYVVSDIASLNSEHIRASAAESFLTTALATESSRAVASEESLRSALSLYGASETSRALAAESALSSAVNFESIRASGAEGSLTTALSLYGASETSRAVAAESSLTTALSLYGASETSRAVAAEVSLTTALSLYGASETSRAVAAEVSLTTALASESSRAVAAESSLTTALASESSRAVAAESSLTTSVTNTNCRIIRDNIVQLNSTSLGGASKPIYITPDHTLANPPVDGWSFVNSSINKKIQWGTAFIDNIGGFSLDAKNGINQIYFTAYINKATTNDDLPYITVYTLQSTASSWYTERIVFVPSGNITTAGLYTFVANFSGNTNLPPATFGSTVVPLIYNSNSVPAAASFSAMTVTQPVFYVTVQTNSASAEGNVNLILQNLCVEANASNVKIPSATYKYIFSNSVVSNEFLYTGLNNLYKQLYDSNVIDNTFVFPGKTSYIGY
jgi:hypothetical protein